MYFDGINREISLADFNDMSDISNDISQDGAAAPNSVEQAASGKSSTPSDVSNTVSDDDTLDIVRDVVEAKVEPADAAASSADGEDDVGDTSPDAPKDETDDYSDVPFNKHPRFQALLTESKAAKAQVKELTVDAQRYRNVETHLGTLGLSGADAANGLTLLAQSRDGGLTGPEMADGLSQMALCKRDPVAGLEAIRPWLQNLLTAAGAVLPDDLKARVQNGELSHEGAKELSQARARLTAQQVQSTLSEQQRQTQAQRQAAQRDQDVVATLVGAAGEWVQDRLKKDPAWSTKEPLVKAEVIKLQEAGWIPKTPEGVKEQLRSAYGRVNGAIRPKTVVAGSDRRPVAPVSGGHTQANARPAAGQSTLDIINSVRAASGH